MLTRLLRWLSGESSEVRAVNAQFAAMDRMAERNRAEREANPVKLYCPKCRPWREIDIYSDENDYICNVHDFVNPVRADGAIISGDGRCVMMRVVGQSREVPDVESSPA